MSQSKISFGGVILLIAAMLFCICLLVSAENNPDNSISLSRKVDNQLVGYWKFDEGSGDIANDSSGYGNHGALINGPVWVPGVQGTALDLDGAEDYVEVPDHSSLDIAGPFTIMCWIYPRYLPTDWVSFVNKYSNYIFQTAESGPRRLRITFKDHDLESPDSVLEENEWQHVAAVCDGEYFRLYKNGTEVAN